MQEELKSISALLSSGVLTEKKMDEIEAVLKQYTAEPKVTIQFLQQVYDHLAVIPKDKNYEGCETKDLLQHKLDALKIKLVNQILEIKRLYEND